MTEVPLKRRADKSARTVLLSSLANIVFTVIAMGIFLILTGNADDKIKEETKARAEQIEHEREERSVESCRQYNRDQTRRRDFQLELIPALAANFFDETPAEIAELVASPGFMQYSDFIIEQFPYRNCTVPCVEAYLDNSIKDCPPTETDEGIA